MLPIAPLMIEHRLIERMIKAMACGVKKMRHQGAADLNFLSSVIDFLTNYADKLHHGKEEDILFRDLRIKNLSSQHREIIEELVAEHVVGRNSVKKLIEAKNKYIPADKAALDDICQSIDMLVSFYPRHIEKEDKKFFIPVMNYLSNLEQEKMLKEFAEFDNKFDIEKYRKLTEQLER